MKTEVPRAWSRRLEARIWDPFTFLLVSFSVFLLGEVQQASTGAYLLRPEAVLVAIVYLFALLITGPGTSDDIYPWYLASVAMKPTKSKTGWQSQTYWYAKFRYRLARYLKSNLRGSK